MISSKAVEIDNPDFVLLHPSSMLDLILMVVLVRESICSTMTIFNYFQLCFPEIDLNVYVNIIYAYRICV